MEEELTRCLWLVIVNRDEKQVHAKVALPNEKGQKLTGKQLLTILNDVCTEKHNNTIMTDEFKGYNILDHKNYIRLVVDYTKEFANGNIHTNGIEGFWSILKRGISGISGNFHRNIH